MISGKTTPHGLFGYPVKHSFSPQMHNAAFKDSKIDGVYLPFEIRPRQLKNALEALVPLGFNGINVTVPHKQNCIKYLNKTDQEAQNIGAVNTIKVNEGKLIGYNTDGKGFLSSLKENKIDIKDKEVMILGAGGASRAINVSMVMEKKIGKIYIYDIKEEKANELTKFLNSISEGIALALGKKEMKEVIKKVDILVNATPVGLEGKKTPVGPNSVSPTLELVYDLIYNPPQTKLLKIAEEKNVKYINGLQMLINQGATSFKIWTGVRPSTEVMREAIPIKKK